MIKKTCGVLCAALLLGLASCSEENPWMGEAGKGAIKLTLTTDSSVKDVSPQTRADGANFFTVPSPEEFSVHLEKHDGSFSKIYERLEHFVAQESFSTGSYNLRVFYGRLEDQGFDKPFMEGVESVNVLEARTTEVTVHAKVANSLVNVNYSDNFRNYLSDYKTTLTTPHGSVEYIGDESRTGFVAPGDVEMTVTFSNPQGESVTLNPAALKAVAGHHYNITFDVKGGESFEPQLVISFDDELTQEDVTIDLTEELFTSPAPSITFNGEGLETDEDGVPVIEFLAGASNDTKYRFTVISHGGIDRVNLTMGSDNNFETGFGENIELVGSSASQQAALTSLGIDVKGLYKNPDRMALVDITSLPQHLAAGTYTLTLQAVDKFTRTHEPVSVKLVAVAPTIEAEGLGAIAGINLGSINVKYTGSNPKSDLRFTAMNAAGRYVDAPIQSYVEAVRTRSIATNSYDLMIKLPDTDRDIIPVRIYLYDKLMTTVELEVVEPEYKLEADGFANSAWIRVTPTDKDMTTLIASNLKLYIGGAQATITERDAENGLIKIEKLSPDQSYTVSGTLLAKPAGDAPSVSFTTETVRDIENGNFADTEQTMYFKEIRAGGIYNFSVMNISHVYQNKCTINRDTPVGWGNINDITCDPKTAVQNTWFMVPSTFVEGDKVTVRTVGYNPAGANIPTVNATALKYYSTAAPAESDLLKAAGQLYYGSDPVKGKAFGSRPASVSFDYTFAAMNGESGVAEVTVYSGDTRIGSGKLLITGTSGTGSVKIAYDMNAAFKKSATSLAIMFKSSSASSPAIHVPTGDELADNTANTPKTGRLTDSGTDSWGEVLKDNSYLSFAYGSILTVGNVSVKY